jgi:tetratricopeptide (TPR) repeat protein
MKTFSMVFISALLLLSCIAQTAAAQSPEEIFRNANQAMNDGRYDQAASGYESLLAAGVESGAIHGNLGQALFRQGKLGEALFHFITAAKLKPRDPDLEANLSYLRARTADKIEPKPRRLPERILKDLSNKMNLRENWIGFLSLWLIFWALAGLRLFWRREFLRWPLWIVAAGLFPITLSLLQKELFERPVGVVVVPEAKVYSGPGEANVALFPLHEGAEVSVLPNEQSGWTAIEITDGRKGWMDEKTLMREASQ